MPIGLRNGRVGILASLIVLVSAVLFIGCLFWLTVNGPWSGGSLFGNDLFKPATYSEHEEETTKPVIIEHEINLTWAINDLAEAGCIFTEYTKEYSEDDIIQLDYQSFREEAIERKIVFRAKNSQEAPVLLVMRSGKIYEWSP